MSVRSAHESRRLTGRAGDIVQATRKLYETKGIAKTTMKNIAEETGVTRELLYYYFSNKEAITNAVIDDYVEDIVESVLVWNEGRSFGDVRGALRSCIQTFRRALYDTNGQPRAMFLVLNELGIREQFAIRAIKETVDCIDAYVVTEYAKHHKIEIELVYEMFCTVIFGLVGLLKLKPDVPNETLMKIVAQTLRLDLSSNKSQTF